jgi:hypothetical protein
MVTYIRHFSWANQLSAVCSWKGTGTKCETVFWPQAHSSLYFHHQSYTLPLSWHWKHTFSASHLFSGITHMHLDFHLQLAIQSTELNHTLCFDSKPMWQCLKCEYRHTGVRQWDHNKKNEGINRSKNSKLQHFINPNTRCHNRIITNISFLFSWCYISLSLIKLS